MAEATQAYTSLRAARKDLQKLKKELEAKGPPVTEGLGRSISGGVDGHFNSCTWFHCSFRCPFY